MEEIKVVKVVSKQEMNDFLNVTDVVYAGCKQYVPDMRSDVRAMFEATGDASQRTSVVQPFVAYRGKELVGRVVGVVNKKANNTWKTRNVRFSMIEFIDDLEVSKALLDTVEAWGKAQGMDKMQGPMGVTDFDKEGMLVEDFELRGSMTAYYNLDYYPKHMEQLGLVKEVDWLQIRINIPKEVPARYARTAQYARELCASVQDGYGASGGERQRRAGGYRRDDAQSVGGAAEVARPSVAHRMVASAEVAEVEARGQHGDVAGGRAPRLSGSGCERPVLRRPYTYL